LRQPPVEGPFSSGGVLTAGLLLQRRLQPLSCFAARIAGLKRVMSPELWTEVFAFVWASGDRTQRKKRDIYATHGDQIHAINRTVAWFDEYLKHRQH
jgi:hypothetical protein